MSSDIVSQDMSTSELIDHLTVRDTRVLRKLLIVMVDYNISLPRALSNAELNWRTRGNGDDKAEFAGFENSLDYWLKFVEK